MKVCFKCGVSKPLTEFYKHSMMSDGHLGKCKDCAKADVLVHRAANLEKVRAYDRARAVLPHRRAKARKITKAWRAADPRRAFAHDKAERHLPVPPAVCEGCGQPKKLERHHPDYDQPLLVEWLCKPCHVKADRVRRAKEQS